MATTTSYNKRSSAVKRILSEARELRNETSHEYAAAPLEDNLFEWHFTMRGPSSSEFEQGIYHGRIILPAEYPFRPPDVMILTPNGRWELNKKICLTFTGFHEEMWQPAWGIRTALIGVQAFMGAKAEVAVGIGSLTFPPAEREKLAKLSGDWKCPICDKSNAELLPVACTNRVQETLPAGLSVDPSGGKQTQSSEADTAIAAAAAASGLSSSMPLDLAKMAAASQGKTAEGLGSDPVEADAGSAPTDGADVNADPSSRGRPLMINTNGGAEVQRGQRRSASEEGFGTEGPPNELLARLAAESHAARPASVASSQVTTPGLASAGSGLHDGETDRSDLTRPSQRGSDSSLRAVDRLEEHRRSAMIADEQASPGQRRATAAEPLPEQVRLDAAPQQQQRATASPSSNMPVTNSSDHAGAALPRAPPGREEVESLRRLATLDRAIATVICLLLALFVRRLLNTSWAG